MGNKHLKLYSEMEVFKSSSDSRFVPCRILVCHDQDNLNGSWFDSETQMKCAEKSIRGIPLLAHVYKNEDDKWVLGGHDTKVEATDTPDGYDYQLIYLEKAYGFVPEDTIITQVEKDGKKYLSCTALIWREYSQQLLDILDSNDGALEVSMEINVDDFSFREDGFFEITDFTFLGITMLGVGVKPAMAGANLSLFTCGDVKTELEEMKKIYSLEKGGETMDKEFENQEVQETEEFENQEETQQEDFTPDEEEQKEECSQDNSEEKKEDCSEEEEDKDKENHSVEDNTEDEKYTQLKTAFDQLKVEYEELKAQLESMSDYEELKQFKADSDAKQFKLEIDSITKKYSLDAEDAKALQDTVLKHEISKEEYEGKLAIMWAKQVKEAQSFSKTKNGKANSIGIINPNEEFIDSNAPYGGRLEKWRTKK